ncbi:ABC transporter substrate-binding protein [Bombiscardovia apis]|nr:ABC transporter substrate-binding protein [Bombiscardovia apis]
MKETRKRLKPSLVFVIALVVLSLIAALIWPVVNRWQHTKAEEAGGTVRIGARQAPASLDIRTETSKAVSQALLGNVYQTVVSLDEHGKVTPGLATSWEHSSDGLTYTFQLRSGETFEDGSPVDSSAVLWSMQQVIENKYPGYETFDNLAKVTNPSGSELVIDLKSPDSRLPYQLATRLGIVYNRGAKVDYSRQSAGSGPYVVDSFKPGEELVLSKSKSYQGPHKAKSAKIIFSYADQSKDQVQQVASGKLDLAVDLSAQEAVAAKGIGSGFTLSTGLSDENLVLAINNSQSAITSDDRFRQAIRYGIDRQAIANSAEGTAKALTGPLNELSVGYDANYAPFQYDVNKASSLASYFNPSFYGGHLRLVYEDSLGQAIGDEIRDQLGKANIPVEVTMLNHDDFQDRVVNKHDYELTLLTMSNADVDQFANPSSTMLFDDPECQQLFRMVTGAKSDDDFAAQLKQYAQTISEKCASAWLTQKTPINASSSKVKGFVDNMSDSYLPAWNLTAN